MKKRLISAVLCLLLSFSLLAIPALAGVKDFSTPPEISKPKIVAEGGGAFLQVQIKTPSSVRSIMDLLSIGDKSHYISGIGMSYSLEGDAWQETDMFFDGIGDMWNGVWRTETIGDLNEGAWVQLRVRFTGVDEDGAPVLSNWSDTLELNRPEDQTEVKEDESGEENGQGNGGSSNAADFEFIAHDWAKPELTEANGLGLIPTDLRTTDLTLPITRAEFAAVSVKVYEALSGVPAVPVEINPFVDTVDQEVLKALGAGITNGLSATEFAPGTLLNREQAATMLSRVFKKVNLPGWSLESDRDFAETFRTLFTMPEPFADDADISSWARDSVYFMASNGILKGMEGGTFQPRAVTEEQKAAGYAQATREQAILIAVRLVNNLGG